MWGCFAGGRSGTIHAAAQQKLMWEALREAVDEEMEADPTVCMMGEQLWERLSAGICFMLLYSGAKILLQHHVLKQTACHRGGCGSLWRLLQGVL